MTTEKKTVNKEVVVSYKGFDNDLKCRGFQYEIGKTYTHEGKVEACASGFHACEYPLDVFTYYAPAGSKFSIVEQSGEIARHSGDSKVASSVIKVKAAIDLPGIIKAAIEYTFSRTTKDEGSSSTGYYGAAFSTGDYGAASATGLRGAASATGKHAVALSCGAGSKAMAGKTGAIVLVYRNAEGKIVHIKASKVGENGIKPNVWYTLDEQGNFKEI